MGTRADFYIGRGVTAEWLGSVGYDGYPDGIDDDLLTAADEAGFRERVAKFLDGRDDATLPAMGWPWPWKDSQTTDYAYAFDGEVWICSFGHSWFKASDPEPENEADGKVPFPDMTDRQNITFGERSGLMIISRRGVP